MEKSNQARPYSVTFDVVPMGHGRILLRHRDQFKTPVLLTHVEDFYAHDSMFHSNHRLYALMNNDQNVGKVEVTITFKERQSDGVES